MDLEISAESFKELLASGPERKFVLVDVREPWEAETAALDDGRLIPMSELPERAPEELDPEAHIVLYCHNGRRSLVAAMWMREQGFARAQSLAGGIDVWSLRIDSSIPRYEK